MTKNLNTVFNISFLVIIIGFGLFGVFQLYNNNPTWLKDRNTTLPQDAFSKAFDRQFSENPKYIKPLAKAKSAIFNKAITPKVIQGKKGWLFLGQEDDRINTITQSLGLKLFPEQELKHWRLLFKQRQTWCQENGIDFHLIIAPNKASVYPEMLPDRISQTFTPTMAEQLATTLESEGINIIQLLPYLVFSKGEKSLFHRNDTHWNDEGARIASNVILKELAPDSLFYNPLSAFSVKDSVKKSGDLARMTLNDDQREESIEILNFKESLVYQQNSEKAAGFPKYLSPEVTSNASGRLPKTQLFHDSFGEMLKPFLSPHFEEIQYFRIWKGFEPYWIEKEKPEIVLNLIVERILMSETTHNDPLLLQWYWPGRFEELAVCNEQSQGLKIDHLENFFLKSDWPEDIILVARLIIESSIKGKLNADYGFQQLNYELNAGENELYLQAIPGQQIKFSFPGENLPQLKDVEWRYF